LPAWVTVHGEAGGHHFDEGYQRLAEQMIAGLPASKVLASPAEAASTAIPASAASAAQSPMATSAAGHR